MTVWMLVALGCVGSYLLGGIPFGLIAGKLKQVDIRQAGSGNIGATNVGRLLGLRWGLGVLALDTLKGFIPTMAAGLFLSGAQAAETLSDTGCTIGWLLVGLCAVLGHDYSPFLRFRGGKGVSTSFGVALGVYPNLALPVLLVAAVWGVVVALWRMSSLGSIVAGVSFPAAYILLAWLRGDPVMRHWPFLTGTLFLGVLIVIRHRANLARILDGTERRLGRVKLSDTSCPPPPG